MSKAALGALLVVDGSEDIRLRPEVADLQEDAVRTADAHQEVVNQRGPLCYLLHRHARGVYVRPPLLPISAVPRRPQALLVLAVLTALVVPSAAFGQSAGDEQYTDPFGGDEPQQAQPQQPEPQQPEAPTGTVEQPAAPAPSEGGGGEVAAEPAQPTDPSLPVTGLPALTLLAVGAGMLAAGLAVRRRA